MVELPDMYPHQALAVDQLRDLLRSGVRRVVLKAGCGVGKTMIAAHIIKMSLDNGKFVGFTFPYLSILDQTIKAFHSYGFEFGVMQAGHRLRNSNEQLQLISIKTLAKNTKAAFNLLIIDECHMRDKGVIERMSDNPDMIVIGLSATPFGDWMGDVYETCIEPIRPSELVSGGYLIDPTYVAMQTVSRDGLKTNSAGEYTVSSVNDVVNTTSVVGNIVDTWIDNADGRPTFIFAASINHSKELAARFVNKGVNAIHLDAYTDRAEKLDVIKSFKAGNIDVLSSVNLLSIGVDCPNLEVVVLAGHVKKLDKHIQMIGRVTRTFTELSNALKSMSYFGVIIVHDKYTVSDIRSSMSVNDLYDESWDDDVIVMSRSDAKGVDFGDLIVCSNVRPDKVGGLVIDHVGNCMLLGGVMDDTPTDLGTGGSDDDSDGDEDRIDSEYEEEIKMMPCINCYTLIKVSQYICPSCGHTDTIDSKISELEGMAVKLNMKKIKKKKKPASATPEEKARVYRLMLHNESENGYKRGFADHVFRGTFGHWPKKKSGITGVEPTAIDRLRYGLKKRSK